MVSLVWDLGWHVGMGCRRSGLAGERSLPRQAAGGVLARSLLGRLLDLLGDAVHEVVELGLLGRGEVVFARPAGTFRLRAIRIPLHHPASAAAASSVVRAALPRVLLLIYSSLFITG